MIAAVLSIGTELTRGELVNSNAAWLSEQLTSLGFEVRAHVTVDDDIERIIAAIAGLAAQHSVLMCTGGLGPTTDDLTTEAVAKALGVPLLRDHASLDRMRGLFASRGRTMSPTNEKQADFPEGAEILPNELGTAPGFSVVLGGCRMFFTPGVPREMKHLWEDRIVPRIADLAVRNSHQIHLRTFGLPESTLGELLEGVEAQFPGVTVGYRASFPEIELKVLARADDVRAAERLAERASEEVKRRVGDIVFGGREDTFAGAIGRTLRDRGLTLAVAESCTGGLVGSMLTSVPGSSDYLLFDAVVYSNSAKTSVLGVGEETLRAYGAVSEETAIAMVNGVLRLSGADIGVSITGIAGPGGGTDEKPVGTVWIAVGNRSGAMFARRFKFWNGREWVQKLSAYSALKMVQKLANGIEP
ncbi:MAG TPA: competence/damage-inducible protein A [Polyangiaceae bacterium]|nr:competence/damage-inducible protein A [Polyangiaceae bacterium]